MARSWTAKFLLVAAVATGVLLLTRLPLFHLGVLERLELATLDYRFALRGPLPLDSADVVIVEIAEDSFRSIPDRFPWPRSTYAHLLTNLRRAGARVVAFDLLFDDADPQGSQNDSLFREALHETGIGVLAGKREEDRPLFTLVSAERNFGNIFYDVDSALGLVNIRPDDDGIYRSYSTAFIVDTSARGGVVVPTFAFAVLNRYFNFRPGTVPRPEGTGFIYAGRILPASDASSVLINYYGPSGTFRRIKFQDVIDDSSFTTAEEKASGEEINTFSDPDYGYLHDGTFRDKIVLVGVTVPEYKDLFPVAVGQGLRRGDNLMYGVELHANLIENILQKRFLRRQPPITDLLMVVGLTLIAFFSTSLIKELRTRRTFLIEILAAAFACVLIGLVWLAATTLFTRGGIILSVTPALLAIGFGYIASTTYHFVIERKQRFLIKSMFSTYVNPQLVEELVNDPSKLVLGGRREELTVLFSDIEGFTTISQDMEPERLVALLNEYLSVMSEIVFRNRGTLDKYEGDAIMAFWGAPLPQADHALLACRTALEMRDALAPLNEQWRREGKPRLNIRIGINTGPMVVGNMGAKGKFAYTVIGDSVNLASRLEGANKEYRTSIMASERTYELVQESIRGRKLDRIAVKGRSVPVTIYEIIQARNASLAPVLDRAYAKYEEGLQFYFERKFDAARNAFSNTLELHPDDVPARVFLARAFDLAATPPPPDWDGVYVMKSK
jgi:adenylate cyclase